MGVLRTGARRRETRETGETRETRDKTETSEKGLWKQ